MVEVFKILNCDTEAAIHQLEMNAGYYYDEVVIRGIRAGIYLFEHPRQFPLVECGDWVRYVKKTED